MVRILNRVLEWTDQGLISEADQRHADIIVKDMGLEKGEQGSGDAGIETGRN